MQAAFAEALRALEAAKGAATRTANEHKARADAAEAQLAAALQDCSRLRVRFPPESIPAAPHCPACLAQAALAEAEARIVRCLAAADGPLR